MPVSFDIGREKHIPRPIVSRFVLSHIAFIILAFVLEWTTVKTSSFSGWIVTPKNFSVSKEFELSALMIVPPVAPASLEAWTT